MTLLTKRAPAAALFACVVLGAGVARAQDERLSLSFTPGIATVSGDTELALSGNAAYRFTEHFSFEGDLTWIDAAAGGFRNRSFTTDGGAYLTAPALDTILQRIGGVFGGNGRPVFGGRDIGRLPVLPGNIGQLFASTDGQTWIGTMGVRYEPTVQTARFRPYVSGGLGFSITDETFSAGATGISRPFTQSVSRSGLAVSAGGGANIHLFGPLWANADAKYFHLSQDRDLVRFGGGATFKF
jgi:hypothetical protein